MSLGHTLAAGALAYERQRVDLSWRDTQGERMQHLRRGSECQWSDCFSNVRTTSTVAPTSSGRSESKRLDGILVKFA